MATSFRARSQWTSQSPSIPSHTNCMPVFVIMDSPHEVATTPPTVSMIPNGFILMMKKFAKFRIRSRAPHTRMPMFSSIDSVVAVVAQTNTPPGTHRDSKTTTTINSLWCHLLHLYNLTFLVLSHLHHHSFTTNLDNQDSLSLSLSWCLYHHSWITNNSIHHHPIIFSQIINN